MIAQHWIPGAIALELVKGFPLASNYECSKRGLDRWWHYLLTFSHHIQIIPNNVKPMCTSYLTPWGDTPT